MSFAAKESGRVCHQCGRREANHPELKWSKMPPIRALATRQAPQGRTPDIDTECEADLRQEKAPSKYATEGYTPP